MSDLAHSWIDMCGITEAFTIWRGRFAMLLLGIETSHGSIGSNIAELPW